MELKRLLLKNFRRFDQIEIAFEHGLNLIKGPNEAGKSTLQDAIIVGLLDRPTGKQRERKFQKWGQDRLYEIDLTYLSSSGEKYTISKDFESESHSIIGPQGKDKSKAGLDEAVLDAIGTLSHDLFVSTACIRQDAMMDMDVGVDEISTQLQKIVMGGEGVVDEVIERLSKVVSEFERGWKTHAPRNPGPIKQLQEQIEKYDQEISRITPEILRKEGAAEELQNLKERLEEIVADLIPRRSQYEIHTRKRLLHERLEEKSQRENELESRIEKVEEAIALREGAQAQLADLSHITDMGDDFQQMYESRQARSIEAGDRLVRFEELRSRTESELSPKTRYQWTWLALFGLGVVLGLWGFLMLLWPEKLLYAQFGPVLAVVGGFLALFGGLRLRGERNGVKTSIREVEAQIREARAHYEDGLKAQESASRQLSGMLDSAGYKTWDEYQKDLKRSQDIRSELLAAESTIKALLRSEGELRELKAKRESASRDRRDAQEELQELDEYADLDPIEFQRMVSDIEVLEGEEQETKEQILRFETILEGEGETIEHLHRAEERRAAAQRKLEHAMGLREVYIITLEGMRVAREDSMSTASDELEPRLGEYLQRVTGGRYDQVLVDDELMLQILHPSKKDSPIDMDELSQGARDQVYLAARLALSDLIFGDARPPLLMDDPFVKFDPERREAALKLCKDLAADRQIILFTCHDGYDAYADHVIELE